MGVVYRAEDPRLGRSVALKVLPSALTHDPAAKERLMHEARAVAALDHPHVCTVYEVAETEAGRPYIALACYEGETLAERLTRGPIPVEEAVRIAREAASGVAAAHARGIVHRDLKPSNVFLCADGTTKVLDFGIAKVPGTALTKTGHTAGTVEYGAPEQARGTVDARSDVWAFGVVLYEMMTGRRPFAAPYEAAVLYAVLHEDPPPPSAHADVPPEVDAVVVRCLSKEPDGRYADAAALGEALDVALRSDVPVPLAAPAARSSAWLGRVRHSWRAVAAAALVLVGLAGAALWSARASASPALPAAIHLAVLPLTPSPDGSDDQAFAEGLAEELADGVLEMRSPEREFSVASVSEARSLQVVSPRQARSVLGANLVLTGTLRRQGDRLALTLELATTDDQARVLDIETVEVSRAQESSIVGRALIAIAEMLQFESIDESGVRLTIGTDDPDAQKFYLSGVTYLERDRDLEDVDRAIDNFEQAIEEDSLFVEAYARLAEAAVAKYNDTLDPTWIDRAEAESERALALDDENPATHIALSVLASARGEDRQAVAHARRALALDSAQNRARLALADAQETFDPAGAEETLKEMVRRDPTAWAGYSRLGWFYVNQQRLEEAEAQFRRQIGLVPDNYLGYLRLGAALHYAGDLEGAETAYQQAISRRPDHPDAYSNLGTLLLQSGDPEGAVERYQEAVALDSTDHEAWRNLASGYYATGNQPAWLEAMRGALRQVDRALEVNPNNPRLLVGAAMYREGTGDPDGALRDAQKAAVLAPQNPLILYDAAVVFGYLGESGRALSALQSAKDAGHKLDGARSEDAFEPIFKDARFLSLLD